MGTTSIVSPSSTARTSTRSERFAGGAADVMSVVNKIADTQPAEMIRNFIAISSGTQLAVPRTSGCKATATNSRMSALKGVPKPVQRDAGGDGDVEGVDL